MFFKKKEEEGKNKVIEILKLQQKEIERLRPFKNAYFVTDRNLQVSKEQYNKLYKIYQALRERLIEIYKEHPELAPKKDRGVTVSSGKQQQDDFNLKGYLNDLIENTSIDDNEKNA
jgi:hypothetical protein